MRFYLFDRVTEFTAGQEAFGIKNVSSQEEFLIGHYSRQPVMPGPLVVESLAQLGGWIVTVSSDYRNLALMLMIRDLEITAEARPGDQIVLQARIENLNEYGAMVSASARVGTQEILRVGGITYGLYEIPEKDREAVRIKYSSYI